MPAVVIPSCWLAVSSKHFLRTERNTLFLLYYVVGDFIDTVREYIHKHVLFGMFCD